MPGSLTSISFSTATDINCDVLKFYETTSDYISAMQKQSPDREMISHCQLPLQYNTIQYIWLRKSLPYFKDCLTCKNDQDSLILKTALPVKMTRIV